MNKLVILMKVDEGQIHRVAHETTNRIKPSIEKPNHQNHQFVNKEM